MQLYEKKDVGEDQNIYVRYASKISGNNLDFLSTLQGENGVWSPGRKHDVAYWKNGRTVLGKFLPSGYYNDWGFCGTSDFYHWDITNDPKFLGDPYWQLDQCWKLYQGGTTFYAYKNRAQHYDDFVLKEIAID